MLRTSKKAREIIARLWLTEGIPFAFRNTPAVYEDLRGWLASNLDIHPKEITLVGSVRLGFSLKKPPIFGRLFGPESDLDLSIISANLFAKICVDFKRFESELSLWDLKPRNDNVKKCWEDNVLNGTRNIPKGFYDPHLIPYIKERYPAAQKMGDLIWHLLKRLEATKTDGVPRIKKASFRVYRDWESFIDRVSYNLYCVVKQA